MVTQAMQQNETDSFLDNDFYRFVVGMLLLVGGPWIGMEMFRAWAYADHWAEPPIIMLSFCLAFLAPILGAGLIIAYRKVPDPKSIKMREGIQNSLLNAGWDVDGEGNTFTITSHDGTVAKVTVETRKEKHNG